MAADADDHKSAKKNPAAMKENLWVEFVFSDHWFLKVRNIIKKYALADECQVMILK